VEGRGEERESTVAMESEKKLRIRPRLSLLEA